MGILITFGSYMKKETSIEGSTKNVEIFDTAIAIAERYGAVGKVRDQGKRRARERGSRGVAVDEEALAIYVQRYLVGLA